MKDITLEELLEAGCHFGHQVNRRNPKADAFIFEARDNVHIIDLEKTREGLIAAGEFVKKLASEGKYLVVVGTKKQAGGIVKEEVERALREAQGKRGIFYITSRWVGGTLTNFPEVSKNFKKLADINTILSSQKDQGYTKRELLLFAREKDKLLNLYEGIATLDRTPDALFIIDTHHESTAVREAKTVGLATVGIVDTNADPFDVTHAIPANDDAVGSVKLITSYIVDSWIEGSKKGSKNNELGIKNQGKKEESEKEASKKS